MNTSMHIALAHPEKFALVCTSGSIPNLFVNFVTNSFLGIRIPTDLCPGLKLGGKAGKRGNNNVTGPGSSL